MIGLDRTKFVERNLRFFMVCCFGLITCGNSGCSDTPKNVSSPAEESLASISIALESVAFSPTCPVSFTYPDIKSVRLRLFKEFPENPEEGSALFDTSDEAIAQDGCLSFVQCGGANVLIDDNDQTTTQEQRIQACLDEGGTLVPASVIHITEIEAQTGLTAYLEAFGDTDCNDRVFVGSRGNIAISSQEARNYFLNPLCVGHFSALPHPGLDYTDTTRNIALQSCEIDCDCIEAFKNELGLSCSEEQFNQDEVPGAPLQCDDGRCTRGYAFEDLLATPCSEDADCTVEYPHSTCEDIGYCTVSSYYPLNMLSGRAFHEATTLPDGQILLTGGLTHSEGKTFTAGPIVPVVFDPAELVFREIPLNGITEEITNALGRAFHSAQLSENKKVVGLAGGLQVVGIEISEDADADAIRKLKLTLSATGPAGGTDSNLHDSLFLMDVNGSPANHNVGLYELTAAGNVGGAEIDSPQPIAMQAADLVYNDSDGQHIFVGGIAPVDTPATNNQAGLLGFQFANANLATTCVYRSTTNVLCKGSASVFTNPRAAAAPACFDRSEDGICERYAVIGGANAPNAPVAEVFLQKTIVITDESGVEQSISIQEFDPVISNGADGLRRSKFTRTISLPDGEVLAVGGTDESFFFGPPNVSSYVLSLSLPTDGDDAPEDSTLSAETIDTSALPGGAQDSYRMHHATTLLDNGLVLVTGGLNATNHSTDNAVLLDPATRQYLPQSLAMTAPRFGHQASLIEQGPLKGAVLITGGLALPAGDTVPELVPFAEIFVP